jgi:phosphohistidine phosphatase
MSSSHRHTGTVKTLLLMRHAKSSHDEEGLSDHERPLNDRGRRDAPRMGVRLKMEGLVPDRVLSSTARRAKETTELVVSGLGQPGEPVFIHSLYHATPQGILEVIAESGAAAERLMVVGHNPGFEQLVRRLTGTEASMPTAAIAIVELPITGWGAVTTAKGRLGDLWTPKDEGE